MGDKYEWGTERKLRVTELSNWKQVSEDKKIYIPFTDFLYSLKNSNNAYINDSLLIQQGLKLKLESDISDVVDGITQGPSS